MKTCKQCGELKTHYGKSPFTIDGMRNPCKDCMRLNHYPIRHLHGLMKIGRTT